MALLHRSGGGRPRPPRRSCNHSLIAVPESTGVDPSDEGFFPEPPSGHLILTAQRVGAVVAAPVVALPCFDLGCTSVTLATVWPPTAMHFEAEGQATAVRVMGV